MLTLLQVESKHNKNQIKGSKDHILQSKRVFLRTICIDNHKLITFEVCLTKDETTPNIFKAIPKTLDTWRIKARNGT